MIGKILQAEWNWGQQTEEMQGGRTQGIGTNIMTSSPIKGGSVWLNTLWHFRLFPDMTYEKNRAQIGFLQNWLTQGYG